MSLPPVEDEAALLYDLDPEVVAAAVLTCPAVAGMSGGPFGAAATYLPGRSVPGVRLDGDRVAVHVVLAPRATVSQCADQIKQVLLGHVVGRPVDIVVEDVADPVDVTPTAAPSVGPTPGPFRTSTAPPTGTPGAGVPRPRPLPER